MTVLLDTPPVADADELAFLNEIAWATAEEVRLFSSQPEAPDPKWMRAVALAHSVLHRSHRRLAQLRRERRLEQASRDGHARRRQSRKIDQPTAGDEPFLLDADFALPVFASLPAESPAPDPSTPPLSEPVTSSASGSDPAPLFARETPAANPAAPAPRSYRSPTRSARRRRTTPRELARRAASVLDAPSTVDAPLAFTAALDPSSLTASASSQEPPFVASSPPRPDLAHRPGPPPSALAALTATPPRDPAPDWPEDIIYAPSLEPNFVLLTQTAEPLRYYARLFSLGFSASDLLSRDRRLTRNDISILRRAIASNLHAPVDPSSPPPGVPIDTDPGSVYVLSITRQSGRDGSIRLPAAG